MGWGCRDGQVKGTNHVELVKYFGTMQFSLSNQLCLVELPNALSYPLPRFLN